MLTQLQHPKSPAFVYNLAIGVNSTVKPIGNINGGLETSYIDETFHPNYRNWEHEKNIEGGDTTVAILLREALEYLIVQYAVYYTRTRRDECKI